MPARFRTTAAVAALAAIALPFQAIAASTPVGLDALKVYNLVVLGNLTSSSEVEGRRSSAATSTAIRRTT